MIIHCTRYASSEVDFWMLVNEELTYSPREYHGVAFCSSRSGHIEPRDEVYVETDHHDKWQIIPDDDVPDFVWKAYGEWLLTGAPGA